MKNITLLFFVFTLVFSSFTYANITVEEGVIFHDGNRNYTANVTFNITESITSVGGELYIDSAPYCDYINRSNFNTTKICPTFIDSGSSAALPEKIVEEESFERVSKIRACMNKKLFSLGNKVFLVKHLCLSLFVILILILIYFIIPKRRKENKK